MGLRTDIALGSVGVTGYFESVFLGDVVGVSLNRVGLKENKGTESRNSKYG